MNPNSAKFLWRDAFICTLFSVIVLGILYFSFIKISVFDPFEKAFEDFSLSDIYTAEDLKELTPTKDIVLINIKHEDRYKIAQAIDIVDSQQPKVIGLDIIFKDRKEPFQDSILKESMIKTKNLVTSFYIENNHLVENNPYFKSNNQSEGFINLNFAEDAAVIREFVGFKRFQNNKYNSFASQLALKAGLLNQTNASTHLEDKLLINYSGKADSFLTFDIGEILNKKDIPALKNAIVIFGYLGTPTGNAFDIEDKFFTPLNPKFAGKSVPDMYGTIIHANIVKMIIGKDFIVKIPNYISYIFAFLCCFLMSAVGLKIDKKSSVVFHLLIKLLQLVVSIILLYVTLLLLKINIHINITPVLILTLLGIEMIVYYGHLFHYLKKRFQWKSYLLN